MKPTPASNPLVTQQDPAASDERTGWKMVEPFASTLLVLLTACGGGGQDPALPEVAATPLVVAVPNQEAAVAAAPEVFTPTPGETAPEETAPLNVSFLLSAQSSVSPADGGIAETTQTNSIAEPAVAMAALATTAAVPLKSAIAAALAIPIVAPPAISTLPPSEPVAKSAKAIKVAYNTAGTTTTVTASVPVIDPNDVVYNISADDPDSFKYSTLACHGANRYWWDWGSAAGKSITPGALPVLDANRKIRADIVADPDSPAENSFMFSVASSDPDLAGAGNKRCELSLGWREYAYPGKVQTKTAFLPRNKDFLWSVKFRLSDWRNTTDRQVLFQWLASDATFLGPMLSMSTWGKKLRLEIHSDFNATPSTTTMLKSIPWELPSWEPNRWYSVVILARIDDVNPANGKVVVWLDGKQVLDQRGPIGYTSSASADYAKVGLYHWTINNPWDGRVDERKAWYKGPMLVHAKPSYTPGLISSNTK